MTTETKATHTPGPWTSAGVHVAADHGPDAEMVPVCEASYRFVTLAEARANARLIAAAPELLQALKQVRYQVAASAEASHLLQGFRRSETAEDRLFQAVDAAIAKAEGR